MDGWDRDRKRDKERDREADIESETERVCKIDGWMDRDSECNRLMDGQRHR